MSATRLLSLLLLVFSIAACLAGRARPAHAGGPSAQPASSAVIALDSQTPQPTPTPPLLTHPPGRTT